MITLTEKQKKILFLLIAEEIKLWSDHIDIPEKYIQELKDIKTAIEKDN